MRLFQNKLSLLNNKLKIYYKGKKILKKLLKKLDTIKKINNIF